MLLFLHVFSFIFSEYDKIKCFKKSVVSGILSVGHPSFSVVSGILSVMGISPVPIPIPIPIPEEIAVAHV